MDKKATDIMSSGVDEQARGAVPEQRSVPPEQPGFVPEQTGVVPEQPGFVPQQPSFVPQQRGKVSDIMTAAPIGVYYSQTIGETARIMRDTQVGAVLVVNDGELSGVVTDRDLVVRGFAEGHDADSPVGPLCSGDVIGVAADADLYQAERLMRENAVRRLPVISDGQVVGIVSMGDLAISVDADSPLAAVSRAQPND